MLAVLVQYNSSHGEAVALALITNDNQEGLEEAVDCAINIERYGYRFSGNDIGAYVVRVTPDSPTFNNGQDYVFIHRYYGGKWRQEWVDEGAKGRFLARRPRVS